MQVVDRSYVFVYGSLKRGYALHHYLTDQTFHGAASTTPSYRLFDCGEYPGMVKVATGGCCVKGEVYCIDHQCLQQLEEVEGVDEGYYKYELIDLQHPFDDFIVFAFLYLLPTSHLNDCHDEWPAV